MTTPSMLLEDITSAISTICASSRSGASLRTMRGLRPVSSEGVRPSRAPVTPDNSFSSWSRFCSPLQRQVSEGRCLSRSSVYLNPGVFGLDTLTTSTSEYGPNVWTPAMKSSIESCADSLFFPRFTASIEPSRKAAVEDSVVGYLKSGIRFLNRARTDACPCEGNPYRFISAWSSVRWKTRGLGFPAYNIC